jgi:DUF971 family protein
MNNHTLSTPPLQLEPEEVQKLKKDGFIQVYSHGAFNGIYQLSTTNAVLFPHAPATADWTWMHGILVANSGKVLAIPRPRVVEWWEAGYTDRNQMQIKAFQEDIEGTEVYLRWMEGSSQFSGWLMWAPPKFAAVEITWMWGVIDLSNLSKEHTHRFVVTDPKGYPKYNVNKSLAYYTGSYTLNGQMYDCPVHAVSGSADRLRKVAMQTTSPTKPVTIADLLEDEDELKGYRVWIDEHHQYQVYAQEYLRKLGERGDMSIEKFNELRAKGSDMVEETDTIPLPLLQRLLNKTLVAGGLPMDNVSSR